MKIAYLINQYPRVSHSFIRREILVLERQGIEQNLYSPILEVGREFQITEIDF
jgi:hypothetical protein